MTTLNEQLTMDAHITAADALAQLSQATGLSDQQLLEQIPDLGWHKTAVMLYCADPGSQNSAILHFVYGDAPNYEIVQSANGITIEPVTEEDESISEDNHEGQWGRHYIGQ